MIPPPPRSRVATLPRLGMAPSSSGDAGRSGSTPIVKEAALPTKYTSVFQSPVKSGNASSSAADTPSRLARFREANWAAKETKKRPRDVENESAIQAPKTRTVARLFADEAPHEATASSQEDAHPGDKAIRGGSTAIVQSSAAASPELIQTHRDKRQVLDRDTQIALGLHQDLVHDSARLKLKMENLKEEIDYFFDVLARIEQVSASARATVEQISGTVDAGDRSTAGICELAKGVQRIISAAKPTASSAFSASSIQEPTGNGAARDPAPASQ